MLCQRLRSGSFSSATFWLQVILVCSPPKRASASSSSSASATRFSLLGPQACRGHAASQLSPLPFPRWLMLFLQARCKSVVSFAISPMAYATQWQKGPLRYVNDKFILMSKLKGQNHVGSFFLWVKVSTEICSGKLQRRIFLGLGLPALEGQVLYVLAVFFAIRKQRVKLQAIIFTSGAESRQSKKHVTWVRNFRKEALTA